MSFNLQFHHNKPCLFAHLLSTCKNLTQLKQTHNLFLKTVSKSHSYYDLLLAELISRLLQFPGDNLRYACNLFDEIPDCRNQFLWTSLIRSHVLNGHSTYAIVLYAKMQRHEIPPTGFTLSSVLNACARLPAMFEGRQVNAKAIRMGFLGNKFVRTALLDMYAKCGFVREAREVFDGMVDRDVVARTAMICGYSKAGMMGEARLLFDKMGHRNVISLGTMVAGYTSCGDMEAAKELYDEMEEKNSVVYVAMISGYGKRGNVLAARRVFDEITRLDPPCWAAMVACYSQNGYAKEAIDMYKKMRDRNITVNMVAMVGAISACTQLGDIEMATEIAKHVDQGGRERTPYVSNALIHMHAKCGNVEEAWREFNRMNDKDVVSYTSLIISFADHGEAMKALELFSKMRSEEITPNQITFVGVLNACSHAGLVEEGCRYFELMTRVFHIKPLNEHYACMVDLLGRAGLVEKAYNLIRKSGKFADAKTWGSLLASCKVHGNEELGEIAAAHLFKIEPENMGNYVLLASIYAEMNKWDKAERLRKMMSEKGIRKSPGRSWILISEMRKLP